jgi:hypothetical protein
MFLCSRGVELRQRLARGVLLRRLLRVSRSDARLLALDHGRAGELALVRRALDVEHGVRDGEGAARELLLEFRLVVDVARHGVLDSVGEGGDDRGADRLEPVLDIERAERCLDERGDDVPVPRELVQLLGRDTCAVLDEFRAQVEAAPDDGAALTRDDVRADLREPALLVVGELLVELLRDREPEDAVAEELEPLVRSRAILGPGRVREDADGPLRRERVDERREGLRCSGRLGGATDAAG